MQINKNELFHYLTRKCFREESFKEEWFQISKSLGYSDEFLNSVSFANTLYKKYSTNTTTHVNQVTRKNS